MRYLIHDFAGHPFQVQLSRQLALEGHEVIHVYPAGLPGPKGRLTKCAGDSERLTIVAIPLSGHFQKYSPVRRFIAQRTYARDLKALISREAPDVVLSGNTPVDIQAELLWCCRKRGIGFVHWVQDVYYRAVEFFLRRKLGALSTIVTAPLRLLEKSIAAHSDSVVVISPDFRQLMAAWGLAQSKLTVIENWAPLEEVPLVSRQNNWSEAHGLTDLPVLLYSGTLGVKHRPDLLHLLARELDGICRVVVVTDGFGKDYLAQMPPLDNLTVLGFQPYERVPEVLASADVLLATLEADAGQFAVPSKILTYLCAGRPLLLAGPKSNLAAKIVERSGAGIVVDPGDAGAWVKSARKLLGSSTYRAELGANARRYAEQTFDIAHIAAAFDRVLAAACHHSQPTASSSPLPVTFQN
jgi:glycosyltransferase involved in cell wall biosynthesis